MSQKAELFIVAAVITCNLSYHESVLKYKQFEILWNNSGTNYLI
jgi:hypothetical protein